MQVATISMTSTGDAKRNMRIAADWVKHAADQGAELVVLPEMFSYLGGYERLWEHGIQQGDSSYTYLSKLACENKILLVAGSVPERSNDDLKKVYNTCFVFDPSGDQLAKYRKINLFHFDGGCSKSRYCEQDGFLAGFEPVRFCYRAWEIGLVICFDLRFPFLFQNLVKKSPLDLLVIPSAFTQFTGEVHWELLLRARAVEYQCYVAASNQVGTHYGNRSSFGHSMIVHPWGHVLRNTGEQEGLVMDKILKEEVLRCRTKIPIGSKGKI